MNKALVYAEKNKERHLINLFKLLSQPSVSASGEGIYDCADLLADLLINTGFKVFMHSYAGSPPVIYAELMVGAPKTIIFYNHYDVQPVDPLSEWKSPPFKPEIREGKIFARGIADNKGNIMSRLLAVESYFQGTGTLPVNVKWVLEGEEEIGSSHLEQFVADKKEVLQGEGIIWESGSRDARGRPIISFGCKGILYAELIARNARRDLHSAYASIVDNPAWHLLKTLGCLKEVSDDRILIPGFYDEVLPPNSEELEMLDKYPFEEETFKQEMGIAKFLGNLSGLELKKKLLYEPTCNICGIASGYSGPGSKTVLPHKAEAKIDFRLVPNQKAQGLFEKMKTHLTNSGFGDIEVIPYGLEDPAQTPVESGLKEVVVDTARDIWGVDPLLSPRMAGTGPMAVFSKHLNLPIVEGIGVGNFSSAVHAPNENCLVEDYFKVVNWVIKILQRI
ncbi:MAG: Succinyl-diaminopimelate desuccinylase [candidate division WS2 bacterium]|uniref:Succinyl-diaminopimelate desuccinylase n=1 Tax=Psychracetigena formicireducens TaxID=2986056 RepID=A0A9E2BLF2_PSYF1|nr:Succinyl-diaminopimelate desuccinylase [Candidatus Psychracetigena formicireducens]